METKESLPPNSNAIESSNKTLADIKVTISLEHFFLLRGGSFNRLKEPYVTVDDLWLKEQGLLNLSDELKDLIYLREVGETNENKEGEETRKLYELWPMTEWRRTFNYKDKKQETLALVKEEEKTKHTVLETWKKEALTKLMSVGKLDAKMALNYIAKAMNPTDSFDFRLAEKLDYPFRSISTTDSNNTTNL